MAGSTVVLARGIFFTPEASTSKRQHRSWIYSTAALYMYFVLAEVSPKRKLVFLYDLIELFFGQVVVGKDTFHSRLIELSKHIFVPDGVLLRTKGIVDFIRPSLRFGTQPRQLRRDRHALLE